MFGRRRKTKRGFFATIRAWIRFGKRLAIFLLILALAGLYYMHRLDRIIAAKFDQPRKWNLPSRVFSDAEYLYPGIDIDSRHLVAKLDRLLYRDTGTSIHGPGDYARTASALEIYLHDFEYPNEVFSGFPLRLELSGSIITSIINKESGEKLDVTRLEPEMVASVFDERMEDRTLVTLSEVPRNLLEAIIAVEDNRFFRHHGVDPVGIARAMFSNFKAGRVVQGGSTLTQQLVKNFFLTPQRSFWRKFNEALMSLQIERRHTKGEILQAYLNEIYLGQRGTSSISGVSEAAKFFFAKNVGQLTLAESALLAGMIRSPNEYNPMKHQGRAKERRNTVLGLMWENKLISEAAYTRAKLEPIVTPKQKVRVVTAPYFIDFVKQQLAEFYPQEVLESEGLRIFTTLDMFSQIVAEEAVVAELAQLEKSYASLLPKSHSGLLQGCVIEMQPSNGYIRAMVGGRDYAESQFNRCTQGRRQPGSTFKPFVYLTALDPIRSQKSITPSTILDDSSFTVQSGGEPWTPKNYDQKEHGRVTVRTALEQSYNIATARLAIDAGLERVVQTAADAGITSPLSPVPSLALGAFEVRPLEMAAAYAIFPNGGIRAEPIAVMNVVTKDGLVVERRSIKMKREFDPAAVYLTTNLMKGVIDRGTGAAARALGFTGIAAGKTGTTSSYRDAWFVGFTPQKLGLVWVGYDDNAEMKMSGARAALPIWARFMRNVALTPNAGDFARPRNVVTIKVDLKNGGRYKKSCKDEFDEAFIDGTEPEESCDEIHLQAYASPDYF
ncbi:MAG: PBP1A family penicillin-binding protein [Deltaproteobacteria bacterium]|nr:PBP1A family penicillin-binding protein [Deltaproteobacteria bacterium]